MSKTRWTVGLKIFTGFLCGTIVTLIIGVTGFVSVKTLDDSLKKIENVYFPRSAALEDLNSLRLRARLTVIETLNLQLTESQEEFKEQLNALRGRRAEIFTGIDAVWEKLLSMPFVQENNISYFNLLKEEYKFWRSSQEMLDGYLEVLSTMENKKDINSLYREYTAITEHTGRVSAAFNETLSELRARNITHMAEITAEDSELSFKTKFRMVCFILLGITCAVILTLIITHQITVPVRQALEMLTAMSRGEHIQEIEIQNDDEIAQMIRLLQNEIAAKLRAEDSSRSKVEFLAMISHEICTPLNAILGLTEVQLQKYGSHQITMDSGTAGAFATIKDSGKELLSIVNAVLDISKIEMGKLEFEPRNYDLAYLLSDVLLPYHELGKSRDIKFTVSMDSGIPAVLYGDPARIAQILENLLSNAFKFTEKGSVSLDIAMFRLGNGLFMLFTVTDTGIGIKESDIGAVFSGFHLVDCSAERKTPGAGLGLAVSRRLAMLMGGTITCKSELGKGSVFCFQAPQRLADGGSIGADVIERLCSFQPLDAVSVQNTLARKQRGRALVVDDIATNIDVAREMISLYNMEADGVLSGAAALKIIEKQEPRYDVIFMDHMMPEMNGVEAVALIRALDSDYAKNIPVIALTANAMAGGKQKFLDAGFNAYLVKPLDIEKLDAEMVKLGRHRAAPLQLDLYEDADIFNGITIKGMNFSDGLKRFGNAAMYKSILHSFIRNMPAVVEKIKTLAASSAGTFAEGREDYSILVHGIKGSARAIGGELVGRLAEELEKAAKAGDIAVLQEKNDIFVRETEELITRLKELARGGILADDTEGNDAGKEEKEKPDGALLKKLAAACDDYDVTAIENLVREMNRYRYTGDNGLSAFIREQIDNFEFSAVSEKIYAVL